MDGVERGAPVTRYPEITNKQTRYAEVPSFPDDRFPDERYTKKTSVHKRYTDVTRL